MKKTAVSTGSTGERGGWPCGLKNLNAVFLLSMVATNLLSIYHLSSRASSANPPPSHSASDQQLLLQQLSAIRATVSHLRSSSSSSSSTPPPPPELVLYSRLAPVGSACSAHPDLLHRFMSYAPFSACPDDARSLAEPLLLRGCHPLPRRRCFSPTPKPASGSIQQLPTDPFAPLPDSAVRWPTDAKKCRSFACLPASLGFDLAGTESTKFLRARGPLDLTLQHRFPVGDGTMDLVRTGHAVNRWIPEPAMEFLWYDADRVLRAGGLLWVDHFWCRKGDLDAVYGAMLRRLGYKTIKWAVADKSSRGGNAKDHDLVYLTALLQKPF